MKIRELKAPTDETVRCIANLVEDDLPPEFRPLPAASVREALGGGWCSGSELSEPIHGLTHPGCVRDDDQLLGAVAVGWRLCADDEADRAD